MNHGNNDNSTISINNSNGSNASKLVRNPTVVRDMGQMRQDENQVVYDLENLKSLVEDQIQEIKILSEGKSRVSNSIETARQGFRDQAVDGGDGGHGSNLNANNNNSNNNNGGNVNGNSVDGDISHLERIFSTLKEQMDEEMKGSKTFENNLKTIQTKLTSILRFLQTEFQIRGRLVDHKGDLETQVKSIQGELQKEINAKEELEKQNYKLLTQVQVFTELRNKDAREKAKLLDSRAQIECDISKYKSAIEDEAKERKELQLQIREIQEVKQKYQNQVRELSNQLENEIKEKARNHQSKSEKDSEISLLKEEVKRLTQVLQNEQNRRIEIEAEWKKLGIENKLLRKRLKNHNLNLVLPTLNNCNNNIVIEGDIFENSIGSTNGTNGNMNLESPNELSDDSTMTVTELESPLNTDKNNHGSNKFNNNNNEKKQILIAKRPTSSSSSSNASNSPKSTSSIITSNRINSKIKFQ